MSWFVTQTELGKTVLKELTIIGAETFASLRRGIDEVSNTWNSYRAKLAEVVGWVVEFGWRIGQAMEEAWSRVKQPVSEAMSNLGQSVQTGITNVLTMRDQLPVEAVPAVRCLDRSRCSEPVAYPQVQQARSKRGPFSYPGVSTPRAPESRSDPRSHTKNTYPRKATHCHTHLSHATDAPRRGPG